MLYLVKMMVMTMMTVILRYSHTKGYPNGIVITVIIVTENADIIASDGLLDILAAKVCWVW